MSRDYILKLIERKDFMELELRQLLSILSKNGVGMTEPLVDAEDYPRSDIDVYQVRVARKKIICLQNDLKKVMKEIEENIHCLHASLVNVDGTIESAERIYTQPVAKVAWVAPNSPADCAGLVAGDHIVEFGSLNSSNFQTISDFTVVVKNSVGRKINVTLKRLDNFVNLQLIPGNWSPNGGLLGCKIIELFENTC